MLKGFSIGDAAISAACEAAIKGGEKQNADGISGCALGNEIFKAQVSHLKMTLLQISGGFGRERSQWEKGGLEEPRSSSQALVLWFWV